jgi:hypothetical protein
MLSGKTLRLVVVAVIAVQMISCGSVEERQYNNYSDVDVVTSLKEGWLPPNISEGAISIREKHDLESGHVFGMYTYSETPFRPGLKNQPSTKAEFMTHLEKVGRPSKPSWFTESDGETVYEYSRFGDFFFAHVRKKKLVLFVR